MIQSVNLEMLYTLFLYKQRFFSAQPQCCLIFSWIQLQMLLRSCLLYIIIIVLRHIWYLVDLCTYLRLVLFMLHLYNLFFIFSLIFIIINHIILLEQTDVLLCAYFSEYFILVLDDNMNEERNNFQIAKVQPQSVA